MTKNYEREDLYPLRQTDDNDEYSNAGFLYDATTAAVAEAINRIFLPLPVRAAFMRTLNNLDSKRCAELNRQVDAAIEAAFNPDPNRSVELDNGAFVAVNFFDQKGTHLGWLGPNGQVVKIQNDGPLGIFQLEYTPESPDEASRRAPGRHELNIPADETTGRATGKSTERPELDIPPATKTPVVQKQPPPSRGHRRLQHPYLARLGRTAPWSWNNRASF
ncbi:uncharacterized protein BDW43DRAFT_316345 [Aspergillus alliaceus]|uniref:uncharacterized protein n=1 Tax=Petromyces alliaceus TaxID=209559 RepID=UPI0012A60AA5|nr:uncharacterized protein BDW43DRAFT_316345 [Aspergillus alliaceus]KAB8227936.1 hypothetical protein BDW43DRAFT_316345 [Aspergillus alliaceus]